eukprot:gene180-190_t
MANLVKIRFKVVHFTSEDPDYPASQLNEVHPTTKGWQSVRFCSYPQELGFQFLDGEERVTQIQLLSHQNKISSKVEIFVGRGPTYASATFKRLGYLSLDSNERSNYQARELKTVFVDNMGSFLKLLIFENHVNKMNTFNQVGVVALSLLGADDRDDAKSVSPAVRGDKPIYKNPCSDLTVDINLDPQTANKLRQLAEAKAKAIASEDYITAKQIKVVEQDLKSLGSRLAQLDMAKSEAVAAEDYDLAKEIKDECDGLRLEIEKKIRAIDIPGVRLVSEKIGARKPSRMIEEEEAVGEPEVRITPRGAVNIDDLPVGGKGGKAPMARLESFNSSGKKAVKVETVEHPGFESSSPPLKGAANYSDALDDDADRPIRPKAQMTYDDKDPSVDDGGDGAGGTGMPLERFPPGEHPLEGIPGFMDLPTPEMLTAPTREFCEIRGITKLFGEYRARCLFSKNWGVHEACMIKLLQLLQTDIAVDSATLSSALPALAAVLKVGAEDKMQQVVFSSLNLLEAVLKFAKQLKLAKAAVAPAFEAVIVQFADKLADGNARLRDGARKGIDLLAASPVVGPFAIAFQLTKPLAAKQKSWRALAARLEVLEDIVRTYGIGSSSGLQLDPLLNFPKVAQAFAHSNKEVRDAAKDLIVAIQAQVGTPPLESTLALLRKNQREEYEAAFEANAKGGAAQGKAAPAGRPNASAKELGESPSGKRTDMAHQHATHHPGGKVPTSSNKVQQQKEGYPLNSPRKAVGGDPEDEGGDPQDFTSCMFCGVQNKSWQENDLDLHYWKDCPLLISCPSCAQIVEIAGLPEHLLDECDAKDSYVPCDITGLAIRKNEFNEWRKSPKCVPAPNNFMYCPLCLSIVEDSDDAWMNHLTRQCPKNSRIQTS